MRDYSEFLTDREIFIIQNHPVMSYKTIGEKFGVSGERVRQIKVHVQRQIRAERTRDEIHARTLASVQLIPP